MPPNLLLIRHGQAVHNATQDLDLPDPGLTPEGEKQCRRLNKNLAKRFKDVDVKDIAVIVSPMRRTIQTALIGLRFLREKGVEFQLDADWQETTSKPCDIGTPIPKLKEDFPDLNYTTLDPIFPDKTSPAAAAYAWSRTSILARGRRCLANAKARPEKWVIAVSHAGFLRQAVTARWWANADYRIFDFVTENSEEDGHDGTGLRLWKDMEKGGMGTSKTERITLGFGIKGRE